MTRNGGPSWCVVPSTVTRLSAIASSSAACVRGVVRLISSASTIWAKTGPGRNSNSRRLLIEDRSAGDVGRQQVGRALNPLERAAHAAGERPGQHRLGDAGHVLQQDVPFAEPSDERQNELLPLADDRLLDVGDDLLRRLIDIRHGGLLFTSRTPCSHALRGNTLL